MWPSVGFHDTDCGRYIKEEAYMVGGGTTWRETVGVYPMPEGRFDTELMQFTGLKDKNGKEIYEGDIVENKEGDMTVIEYGFQEVDAFVGVGFNLWPFQDAPDYKGIHDASESALRQYKVIGNIYENPELVNK
jgi:uncharacterized phage protein (TIGR01671 family)